MTDLAGALADTSHLTPFEGLPVVQTGIEIPGASGGLRPALSVDPQEFHKGQRVYVVLECVIGKVRFDPVDKEEPAGAQARVHVFNVENATMVDGEMVREALDSQRDRIQAAQDAAQGIQRLNLEGEPDEEAPEVALARQHAAGVHSDGLREGCPDCDAEATAAAEEAAAPDAPTPIGRGKRK